MQILQAGRRSRSGDESLEFSALTKTLGQRALCSPGPVRSRTEHMTGPWVRELLRVFVSAFGEEANEIIRRHHVPKTAR